jgi:hypothetical protein
VIGINISKFLYLNSVDELDVVRTGRESFSIGHRPYCFTWRDCWVGSAGRDPAVVSSRPKEKIRLLFWCESGEISPSISQRCETWLFYHFDRFCGGNSKIRSVYL